MKSIYNENLVMTDEMMIGLSDAFAEVTRAFFGCAQQEGYNLREISHEFSQRMTLVESELILMANARKLDSNELSSRV